MQAMTLQIRPFEPADSTAFRQLNEQWIAKYFTIEEQDRKVLNDPENYVLRRGGQIFMAMSEGTPLGCCALIPTEPGTYELAKMSVSEECRGQGIGRKVLEHTIEQAKALGARRLYLETNTLLENAIHLYESFGFRHLPRETVAPSPYARSNVAMELVL
jgi:putative acetyltransferase